MREIEQVLRFGAAQRSKRPADVDPAPRRLLAGGRGDSMLGEPAREVLAGDLALRPPQRSALAVTASAQAPPAVADEELAVHDRLAGVGHVVGSGETCDRGGCPPGLVGREAAELQG